jgi:flagellin-like hook-associated protein FlgL
LSSVVAQANTSLDGVYAFGGTLSNSPPFVQASSSFTSAAGSSAAPLTPSTALTAGATTKVSDAGTGKTFTFTAAAGDTISTLQSAISDAVAAGTLSSGVSASINSGGHLSIEASPQVGVFVSSTDGELGGMAADSGTAVENAYAYVGTNNTNNVSIGNNLSVSAGIAGSKIFSPGNGNVLGALQQLVTALQSNDPASVASATSKVSASLKAVNEARVPIGSSVNQMNAQETSLSQETVTLSSQQTSLVGIDLAEAATNLAQAQLVQGATLAAAAKAVPQTLLDYLK